MEEQFGQSYYCSGSCIAVLTLIVHAVLRRPTTSSGKKKAGPRLPPGPWKLPLIGSLHHLLSPTTLPHHTMRDLSSRHGPLMLLRIGERDAAVVSSPAAAREVLHLRDDAAFEQRPGTPGVHELYARHGTGIVFAPYSEHWRLLRRVLSVALLGGGTARRHGNAFHRVSEDEAARLAASFFATPSAGQRLAAVNVDERLAEFVAAMEATTSTLRWAMAELMANPRVMGKAQSEVRRVFAGQERVHEGLLSDLSYLKAVIKETIRLHPPIPLVPRLCTEDRKVQGYDVPKGTIILVNVWAISRNRTYWEDHDKFMPERFEGEHSLNFLGMDFEFIPFGAGRRICPGIAFSQANIEIALATLLFHFDWKLPDGVKPEELDMTESLGLAVKRKAKLLLHPIPYTSGPSV